jgi:hypothetical protein
MLCVDRNDSVLSYKLRKQVSLPILIAIALAILLWGFLFRNKQRVCPDAWYEDRLPSFSHTQELEENHQYFIVKTKVRELKDYDVEWIKTHCMVRTPTTVY